MINENSTFCIVSCDVFSKEIEAFYDTIKYKPMHMEFFDAGLHITPNEMKRQLQERIDNCEKEYNPDYLLLLAGLCGNATLKLQTSSSKLVIPRIHDCISIFLGSSEKYLELKKVKPCAYFSSPGWVKSKLPPGKELEEKTLKMYQELYPDDEEYVEDLMIAFNDQFSAYNAYVYTDLISDDAAEQTCKDCAAHLNWSYEKVQGDPQFLLDALNRKWDDRFLIADPNTPIKADMGGKILNV